MRPAHLILVPFVIQALTACGQERAQGDPDGVPVAFTVRLESVFVADYHRDGGATSFGFHHHHHLHHGRLHHGLWHDPWDPWDGGMGYAGPASTTLALLGGEGPTQAQIFRKRLDFGDNDFVIPIRPGRTVTLTFQADGGIEGWETLGSFSVGDQPGQVVAISMTAEGVAITSTPVTPPPAEAAAPAPATTP